MIHINEIIFNNEMNIEERVLYAYLLNEKAMQKASVEHGYLKIEDVTEDGEYYTIHSNQELMNLLKCGKTKLIKIKKQLENKGLLKQKRVLDGSNKYFTYKEVKVR